VISLFACPAKISVKKLDDFRFSSRLMLNLGLIVNELLTNSMKYAFTGRDSGNVMISVVKRGDLIRLDIQDDGNGLPDDFNMASMGFGLTLVNLLSRQMGGDFRIENNSGTLCSLEFSASL
jgi:two-component sensor histidine kinase